MDMELVGFNGGGIETRVEPSLGTPVEHGLSIPPARDLDLAFCGPFDPDYTSPDDVTVIAEAAVRVKDSMLYHDGANFSLVINLDSSNVCSNDADTEPYPLYEKELLHCTEPGRIIKVLARNGGTVLIESPEFTGVVSVMQEDSAGRVAKSLYEAVTEFAHISACDSSAGTVADTYLNSGIVERINDMIRSLPGQTDALIYSYPDGLASILRRGERIAGSKVLSANKKLAFMGELILAASKYDEGSNYTEATLHHLEYLVELVAERQFGNEDIIAEDLAREQGAIGRKYHPTMLAPDALDHNVDRLAERRVDDKLLMERVRRESQQSQRYAGTAYSDPLDDVDAAAREEEIAIKRLCGAPGLPVLPEQSKVGTPEYEKVIAAIAGKRLEQVSIALEKYGAVRFSL